MPLTGNVPRKVKFPPRQGTNKYVNWFAVGENKSYWQVQVDCNISYVFVKLKLMQLFNITKEELELWPAAITTVETHRHRD